MAERSSLVRLQDEFDIALEWNGYELHPETPPGGMPLDRYLPNAEAMLRYVRSFAEGFGISDLRPPSRLPSTRRALAATADPALLARVDAARARALEAGVTGIPTFDIGPLRVVGCQPYEVLAAAARKAGAGRRS